jgi:hypothetical protein
VGPAKDPQGIQPALPLKSPANGVRINRDAPREIARHTERNGGFYRRAPQVLLPARRGFCKMPPAFVIFIRGPCMLLDLLMFAMTMGRPADSLVPQVECRVERVEIGVPAAGERRVFRKSREGISLKFEVTWPAQ